MTIRLFSGGTRVQASELDAASDNDDLLARVAHLYYVLDETQATIAQRLGMTRIKVHRLLAEARERGIVDIRIDARGGRTLELGKRLADRFGLDFCRLTPSDENAARSISEIVGTYAGAAMAPLFLPGMTIAIAWGITLQAMARAIPKRSIPGVTIVPMLGSLSKRSTVERVEAGTLLSQSLDAECFYLPGPVLADSRESREAIMSQPLAREVVGRARSADLALASVGGTGMETLRAVGQVETALYDEVRAMGAIGNFLGYAIGPDGEVLDHPMNERVIGLHPKEFPAIARRILVSGGVSKVPVMRRLLLNGAFSGLVTDEATGLLLLQDG